MLKMTAVPLRGAQGQREGRVVKLMTAGDNPNYARLVIRVQCTGTSTDHHDRDVLEEENQGNKYVQICYLPVQLWGCTLIRD